MKQDIARFFKVLEALPVQVSEVSSTDWKLMQDRVGSHRQRELRVVGALPYDCYSFKQIFDMLSPFCYILSMQILLGTSLNHRESISGEFSGFSVFSLSTTIELTLLEVEETPQLCDTPTPTPAP